jgi:hypothetical protein
LLIFPELAALASDLWDWAVHDLPPTNATV